MSGYLDELFGLRDKTALVTGGTSGIGRAIALALGRAGANVVVLARGTEALDGTVAELESHGCSAAAVAADLSRGRAAIREAAERAVLPFGEPDILVNSAGVNPRPHMDDLTDDHWDTSLAVNLDAPYVLGQRFGPAMAARGWGRVLNIGSQQSFRAFFNSGAYGVSKAGVVALTRSQAEAWSSRGVTCNTLIPGFVITPLTAQASADPAFLAELAGRTFVGRNGLPADFPAAALFLTSPAASFVTGQALFVDGGFSAH
ncbi:SDR family NAD(P)-dependent oxidoreductase [Actinocorallia longicatena]|uniref:Glucose 1-dehydrogenase n=1 Tax=Actinocorallia longicatena TaxID=111803 RepID=A0ABP6QK78_9ACTN